ncbi:P-loop containing nucleoside triphosphate hydrolase protein [Mycena metata]|uniref:P-loop containing nucleoside triphosphate hydrolase protein n=1 Tax=Mycena metata TaxID=1033252 RepID=A0AAD7NMD4_9AGAR|nr:P-loop containing nucleoside triphosphate hydrolase protein [Mycena metata]
MAEPSDITHDEKKTPDELFKKRVAQFDYYYDMRTFSYRLRKSVKQKKDQKNKYAIVIRRLIDERGQFRGTALDIKSADLCNVLLDINEGVEDSELSRREPTTTEEVMYYSYPGLLKRLALEEEKEEKNEPLIRDIQAGIFYVDEYLGEKRKDVEKMVSQREISWDALWALFFPNSFVYSYHSLTDQDTVLIVRRSGYDTRMSDRTKYLKVVCDIIKDDGREFGFARHVFEIDEYRGTRPIANLPVFPLRYHDANEAIYARAVELGKRCMQLPTHSYHELSGRAFRNDTEQIFVNGRVMISALAYARFYSTPSETDSQTREKLVERLSRETTEVHTALKRDSLTDDQYAICSPILRGFAFDLKTWGSFPLTRLRDVDWNEAAFEGLVLGPKQKKLIHSLVRQHIKRETNFDDIIKGKGQGLIGLLAGTPGCGKTLTAEAVAEVTHRPLYALSAGELGITPSSVESKLDSVLQLAQMWNAVLLLDEAEVFLTKRNVTDLQRNALVSIFLRLLEYYQGILILTTNMPEQCDHAFESRIHFSVNYPELDSTARRIIWTMFFKRACIDILEEDLDRLAAHEINGRQVRFLHIFNLHNISNCSSRSRMHSAAL